MEKIILVIVITLLVILVVAYLSGWRSSERRGVLDRFPVSKVNSLISEDFVSQTVPTSVFQMYRLVKNAFDDYGLQVGYKFKGEKTAWEFYTTALKGHIDFEHWIKCYKTIFPDGYEESSYVENIGIKDSHIFCVSMDIDEDTINVATLPQLNVYYSVKGELKYEYTLLSDDPRPKYRGEAAYQIQSRGKGNEDKVAVEASRKGFNGDHAEALMKIVSEMGWSSMLYGFVEKGDQVGIYLYIPDTSTVRSYLETFRPHYNGIKDSGLKNIIEIALYFQDFPNNKLVVRDAFYVAL